MHLWVWNPSSIRATLLVKAVGATLENFDGLLQLVLFSASHQGARVIESGLLVIDGQQAKPSGSGCRSQCREDTLPSPSIV